MGSEPQPKAMVSVKPPCEARFTEMVAFSPVFMVSVAGLSVRLKLLAVPLTVTAGEVEVLFLADKLTIGADVVSLSRKQERAEELFVADADALAGARRRLADARALAGRIEQLVGRPLTAVVAGDPGGPGR